VRMAMTHASRVSHELMSQQPAEFRMGDLVGELSEVAHEVTHAHEYFFTSLVSRAGSELILAEYKHS
jgi:hypothetical protein